MTYEQIENWINNSMQLEGNDFIQWNEIKSKISEISFLYVTYLIGYMNQDIIFKTNSTKEIEYTKQLLKESIK